jgi:hypothetical protein
MERIITTVKECCDRRLLAGLFVLFLLAEFGSHGVAFASHSEADGRSVSETERGHEDPCATLIVCSNSQQRDQQRQKSVDTWQHNGLIDQFAGLRRHVVSSLSHSGINFEPAAGLFQPPNPPFHPPKLS